MSAPMPTRRPNRPDSQYYRTARRQSLRRGGNLNAGKAATLAVLGAAAFLVLWWMHRGGVWEVVAGSFGLPALAAVAGFVAFSGRR